MSFESALGRINELRALSGSASGVADVSARGSSAPAATSTTNGAFQAQLAEQQVRLVANGGGTSGPSGASQFGLPVYTVADQYRMLGLPVPTAVLPAGYAYSSGAPGMAGSKMVALAQQELARDVRESSGNNESPRIREYRAATAGAENTPGPWCAYFVSWLAREAGAPIGAGGNGTGYVPTLEAWGKQEDRFLEHGTGRPNPGDVVIFDWGGDGVPDHTGIVERVDPDGRIHTIEGNASDTILRRTYPADTSHITGYVRM